jgi:hypothetical protein
MLHRCLERWSAPGNREFVLVGQPLFPKQILPIHVDALDAHARAQLHMWFQKHAQNSPGIGAFAGECEASDRCERQVAVAPPHSAR